MAKALRARAVAEWPTLLLLVACYGGWLLGTTWAAALWLPLGMVVVTLCVALHSSLCHEALHGHPMRDARLNEALVFPALSLVVPYRRFRDTHLAHHRDEHLTDPYDDPESNYLDPAVWARLPGWLRWVLALNNTLAGRLLVGPLVGQVAFMRDDLRAIRAGVPGVLSAWLWHVPAVLLVSWWLVAVAQMPIWAYLLSVYAALSILKIRTFLEHRAHDKARGRTVIIEDRGPLALIFLNNNLHVVHHMHPKVPWYRLPALYAAHRAHYLGRNDGYLYRSYGEIFRRHFLRAKDPVPHPLWPRR
ncbi:fatty acid desaturase [Roseovarius halotolerans]|uniref:Fatty acid desaturase n=1 Tax=Roseovarius halotolerans TaxID=505353 RepID=A0A1X6Y806_9RHOB|nr:fatty acid desaturase [Roseovarius halotolerans]RKT35137.1 fatty acid desaturase [Roseovarius halotolerans]SLN13362.1 Fatty acid desaturase [Roseovarius halotolerans]